MERTWSDLTPGNGEACNPSWHPDGQKIAFAWTQGFATGAFNIFIMDVATRSDYVQLTHGEGKNENPSWAPDGIHIVFRPSAAARPADLFHAGGRHASAATDHAGDNERPVWGK